MASSKKLSTKKIIKSVLIVLALLFTISKGMEWLIESKFQDMINSNPDRAYNITYSDLDLDTFLKGITLNNVSIKPINSQKGTIIRGRVDYASINGLVWNDLLFDKKLNINEIAFERPKFEVTLGTDTTKTVNGKGLQLMFGDILSRANVNYFRINNGSIVLKDSLSQAVRGQVKRLNIVATEIETDSLKFKHIIPFEMGNLELDVDSISFELNDYTHVELGRFHYSLKNKEMLLNDISLGYSIDWVEVSRREGVQNVIVEFNIREIGIQQLDSDNFYTHLDIVAEKISINDLNIKLQRNKNIPRPPDTAKPTFQEIINTIPIAFVIDSVQISNSSVAYGELGVKKSESGLIKIQKINGNITGVTNMPEQQKNFGELDANINARLVDKAGLNVALKVPYDSERFSIAVAIGEMEMKNLNPTLKPLAGMEIVSGQMKRIQFYMNAGRIQSQNKLVFDYSDLHIEMLNEKGKNKEKKKVLLSAIANGAIRPNNVPDQKKYLVAEYQSQRNRYRSPINYIIQGLIQGFTRIVPGGLVQKLIVNDNKKKRKKKKKN